LGVALDVTLGGSDRGGRRVSNQRLHEVGYSLRFPDWRSGYEQQLKARADG
jgi:hypothetical protein